MNAIETDKRGPTQQIFHRVVEPSLGNLKLDFYPHYHSVRLHTAFYPQQSHCQLESESLASLPRPRTHPIIKQDGMLPKIAKKKAITKRSHSRAGSVGPSHSIPWSFHSVSQTKELPLLTSRSQDRGSHLLTKNAKKAVSVSSQYRYLGPSKALQSQSIGSHDEEEPKTEQVRRFEGELKSLEHTRHLKRVSEIATYQHRQDRMYFMCGSKAPLHGKYSVDNEELEKLRAFSMARSQSRGSSARRSAAGGRIRDARSSFVSETDNQTDPGLTIDIVAGTVIRSPASDRFGNEKSASGDEGTTGADGSKEKGGPAHLKSLSGEGDTCDAEAPGLSADTSTDVHGETLNSDERLADESGCAHIAFVTEETFQETDLAQEHVNDTTHLESTSSPQQCPDDEVEAPENEEKSSTDNPTSSQAQNTSEQLKDINRTGGEQDDENAGDREQSRDNQNTSATLKDINRTGGEHDDENAGDREQSRDNHGLSDDREDEDDDDGESNATSPRNPLKDEEESNGAVEQSVIEGNTSDGALKTNQQDLRFGSGHQGSDSQRIVLGFGIVLDKTPYHATKKQIYDNTTFDNPALKQFEDLATLSKGDEDGPYGAANFHMSEQSIDDDGRSFISNQSDAVIAQMEGDMVSKDHLSDHLSRVGHLEDSTLDEDLLREEAEGAADWDNGVYGTVLNDEERQKKEEMKEKRHREKDAAKERQRKQPVKEETPAVPSPRKLNLTDIYSFITARQKMIFQKKFQDLDVDHNGKLTLKELTQRMNKGVKKEELKEFMRVFDLNKDKTVDEREFVTVAALNDKLQGQEIQSENSNLQLNLSKLALHITAYKEVFEMTDQDRNGYLSLEEVMFVISVSVGTEIGTDKEILDYIFKNLDVNGSGSIDFIEFLSFIPFFLKLHQEIVGRPATIEDVVKANAAVKEALSKKR